MNKFAFFADLAECAAEAIRNEPEISARELCRAEVNKAEEIYREMRAA